MGISKGTQEKINLLFKANSEMITKLYNCDPDAIREIGSLSQKGINPDDVIDAYESGEPSSLDYLYKQAKKLILLQELYKDLCVEYYRKIKDIPEDVMQPNSERGNVKKH